MPIAYLGSGGWRAPSFPFTLSTGYIKSIRHSQYTFVLDLFFVRSVPDFRGYSRCFPKKWLGTQMVSIAFEIRKKPTSIYEYKKRPIDIIFVNRPVNN